MFTEGWNINPKMDPQDWIDYELKELPYEKCKEYGLWSPEEISAYKHKYPKCEYVYNCVWGDKSKGSSCAIYPCTHGGYNAKPDVNISPYCYKYPYYKERVTPIRDIQAKDSEDYESYIRMKAKGQDLEEKFGNL